MKFKKICSCLASTLLIATAFVGTVQAETPSLRRIGGINRYDTSISISHEFEKSEYAVIASGSSYSDALFGSTLSAQEKAPLFLTGRHNLYPRIYRELSRLGVKEVFILGGTDTISNNVDEQIKSKGLKTTRIEGYNRFSTANAVNNKRLELSSNRNITNAIKAGVDANKFSDALVASPLVSMYGENSSIVLLYPDTNDSYSWYFGGGKKGTDVSFSGPNRYSTAVSVATKYIEYSKNEVDTVILANGQNFPDALSASALSAKYNAPILLTSSSTVNKYTMDFINNNNIKNIISVGGYDSIDPYVLLSYKLGSVVTKPSANKPSASVDNNSSVSDENIIVYENTDTTSDTNKTEELYNGPVKANIESGIYHLPWGAHFNRLKDPDKIRWFNNEKEAIDAGYRKSEK